MGNSAQQPAGECFNGLQRSMGADFNTAVTANATIIIKADDFFIGRNGPCRANVPALTAHFTNPSLNRRTLNEMLAHIFLHGFRAEGQGDQFGQLVIGDFAKIADDFRFTIQYAQFFGCMQGR